MPETDARYNSPDRQADERSSRRAVEPSTQKSGQRSRSQASPIALPCGPGRVGAGLAARGHVVVGVDADGELIEAAKDVHPGPIWPVAHLAELDLAELDLAELGLADQGGPEPLDAAVCAANMMPFLASGTEGEVLRRIAAHLRHDGLFVVGFGVDRGYAIADFDRKASVAGNLYGEDSGAQAARAQRHDRARRLWRRASPARNQWRGAGSGLTRRR